MNYIIYTDGACSVSKQLGGYAAIAKYGGQQIVIHGSKVKATNNEMELLAAVSIMRQVVSLVKPGDIVIVYSDSAYVVNAIQNKWFLGWQTNGWKTTDGKDVRNKKLWQELIAYCKKTNAVFMKVKGHSGVKMNEIADKLASKEVDLLKAKQLED